MFKPSRCPSYEDVDCQATEKALQEAIRGEAAAIKFYSYLIRLTPDQEQRDIVYGIRADEKRHLNNFQAAYCRLTGRTYCYPEPDVDEPENYCQGLLKAFIDEQEAYEFYKANYFCNRCDLVEKAFFDALLDEAEHARWFNNLLIRNGCFQDS